MEKKTLSLAKIIFIIVNYIFFGGLSAFLFLIAAQGISEKAPPTAVGLFVSMGLGVVIIAIGFHFVIDRIFK